MGHEANSNSFNHSTPRDPCFIFDESYYCGIWGSVHRHDYCPDLAHALVTQYGRGRFLDIGGGCGYLIECLRRLGATAWGIEISDHALAHRCSSYLIPGSVLAIPFADMRCDVIHSQGLWEYIAEKDVSQAWAECQRVGRIQHHNYDAAENTILPEHQMVTVKPRAWWEARLQ